MHRKNPISVLVYNTLFPTPSPTDPPSFSAHLSKNLVGEVRIETANFYGSLDTIEARYPGLNYAFQPHRKRLGRFPHHKRLFEAFDKLGLTEAEIQGFCRWEGTLWARERYERDEGVKVVDTTGVEIGAWVDTRSHYSKSRPGINVKTDIEVEIEELQQQQQNSRSHQASNTTTTSSAARPTQGDTEMPDSPTTTTTTSHQQSDSETDSDSDADSTSSSSSAAHLPPSLNFSLNARLLHAAAASATGTSSSSSASNNSLPPMDPEWEQYLKEASERGELNIDATREALRNMAGQIAQLHQQSSSGVRNGGGVEVDASEVVGQQQQAFQPPAAPA